MSRIIEQFFDFVESLKSDSSKAYVHATSDHLRALAKPYHALNEHRFGAIESGIF